MEAIDELEIPVDGRSLRTALALSDRLQAKITTAVGEFDRALAWQETGATSMKAWLRDEGLASPDAHRLTTWAARLQRLPVLASAWRTGELANGHIRAVMENLTDRHLGLFADHEPAVVPALVGLSVTETNKAMAAWRTKADALIPDPKPDEPEGKLSHSETLGGRWVTNGTFDGAAGKVIATALAAADIGDLNKPPAQRRATALETICRFFLDNHTSTTPRRNRPHVSLIINADDLARGDGTARSESATYTSGFDAATTSMYLCDCGISRVVADKIAGATSRILNLGRTTETVTQSQRTALAVRDRHCRWPGCDRPPSWCDAHHVTWWTRGGPTDLDNLVLLCSRHHHLIHRDERFHLKLLPDATLEVTTPTGTTRTTRPPGTHDTLLL